MIPATVPAMEVHLMKKFLMAFVVAAMVLAVASPASAAGPQPGVPGAPNCKGQTVAYLAQGNALAGLRPAHGIGNVAKVNNMSVAAVMEVVGAHCTPPPQQLQWSTPPEIHLFVPATYASIDPCPPGTTMVFVTLLFLPAGASTFGPFTPAADGSWSADIAFGAVVPPFPATANASCFSAPNTPPLATYEPHPITILP